MTLSILKSKRPALTPRPHLLRLRQIVGGTGYLILQKTPDVFSKNSPTKKGKKEKKKKEKKRRKKRKKYWWIELSDAGTSLMLTSGASIFLF